MLKIEDLNKFFGGIKAVDGCSFEIKEKTITALIGPNGSGKTTIFNLISGILRPDSGKIMLGGKDITDKSIEDISNLGISRLFQQTRLFNNLTVRENLLLALDNEDTKFWSVFVLRASADKKNKFEKKIQEMLELVGLEEFADKLARDLSYGQKRLIELSRAILNPHNFLMLDEPVSGVAPRLREKIKEILIGLKEKGETILLIEHDMNFAFKISDDVIVLEKGRVIAEGKPDEIKNNPRVLEAYLGN
ncbi:ABC transporter ATP-binding protein [Patescibacteria group bacterium]|nr:ABC transporter ATP-binding protein [Patescibacteria group bacterium]MBU4347334.1 ABC transporter ATP-binding protein [Patescibacteria group bacterium]MBU4455266.1 ABC transporter ATP-binding protein [Patescibacteria group bacterium]MCG2691097.1 ABC transporter ATP-binding protein [Candidatus Parcubacteria bacterium]